MPKIHIPVVEAFNNVLLSNELSYDCNGMLLKHTTNFQTLSDEQLSAYQEIVYVVDNNLGHMFCVDGFGGKGKTYIWNALSFLFGLEDKIVHNVASSGIANPTSSWWKNCSFSICYTISVIRGVVCRIEKHSKRQSYW